MPAAGEPRTDVATSEDGTKRIITKTGVYSGTELHAYAAAPYYDPRLPVVPGRPDLCFNAQRREIATTEEWQEVGGGGRGGARSGRRRMPCAAWWRVPCLGGAVGGSPAPT